MPPDRKLPWQLAAPVHLALKAHDACVRHDVVLQVFSLALVAALKGGKKLEAFAIR
jgi:hypothetical protein